jgi:hypothetical protein
MSNKTLNNTHSGVYKNKKDFDSQFHDPKNKTPEKNLHKSPLNNKKLSLKKIQLLNKKYSQSLHPPTSKKRSLSAKLVILLILQSFLF